MGGMVSTTVMVCTQDEVFPHSSVAVHVLEMISVPPQPGTELSVKVIAGVPQASVPVANPVDAGDVSSPHSTVTLAGHTITGGVVSTTVMNCEHASTFPHSSSATHVL